MSTNERETNRPSDRMRPGALLPLVRAAMARGEGPPAVLAWVRAHGHAKQPLNWSTSDEARARALADRLATTLINSGARGDPRTRQFGETFAGTPSTC